MTASVHKLKVASENSVQRHANGFSKLEPMIRDLERYAMLLDERIDRKEEDDLEIRDMLSMEVKKRCTELRDEYYRLWGE